MTSSEIADSVDWKAEWELACALRIADRQKSQEIINERDKWIVELINERDAANAKLKIATEALEEISKGNRGEFESGDHMAFDKLMRAAQALARMKEAG